MQQRKLTAYPPYYFLIAAHILGKDEEKTLRAATEIKQAVVEEAQDEVLAIGPLTPYYAFTGDRYKKVVVFKTKKPAELKEILHRLSTSFSHFGGIDIVFDVDPLDY